jgi:hypothetical protein
MTLHSFEFTTEAVPASILRRVPYNVKRFFVGNSLGNGIDTSQIEAKSKLLPPHSVGEGRGGGANVD